MSAARVLLSAGNYVGAYQCGGIALECALKARIAGQVQAGEFPDKRLAEKAWKHEPPELLAAGNLVRFLKQANAAVEANWATVKDWRIDSRYNPNITQLVAEGFLNVLDQGSDGVLAWLRTLS